MTVYLDGPAQTEPVEIILINRGRGIALVKDNRGVTGIEEINDLWSPEYGWLF